MALYENYIERVPGVQGGYPVIRGTRTPVRSIIMLYRDVYPSDLSALCHALPHLTRAEIEAAIAYYQHHPALVDEDIARQRVAMDRHLANP